MKHFLIIAVAIVLSAGAFAQNITLSGNLRDATSGEDLIGASVYIASISSGVTANVYGFYSLSVPAGKYEVKFSYIGYVDQVKTIDLSSDIKMDIELSPNVEAIGEAVIEGEAENANIKEVEMSVNKLDAKAIKKIPALLGEADVVKSILLLPGISTIGEGSTGFNARGGGIDQNLIILDEAPVYNSSHLFGFFSVFNPDAVKNVKLVKGGIEPQYGGRLSSVLDVRLKEGNRKEFAGSGGVGLIFSRLALEAPIVKDKASFIVAGRRSYADVLAKPFLNDGLEDSDFYFYDLTAKANWEINQNNRVFLSGYFGRDAFGFSGLIFDWGNATATARWNHIFGNRLFMNLTAFYSDYDYRFVVGETGVDGFNWKSSVLNYSGKADLTFFANNNNKIDFGAQVILYDFKPALASFSSAGVSNSLSLPEKRMNEMAIYAQNEQKISDRLSLKYGVRGTLYQYVGEGDAFEFADNADQERRNLTNITSFGKGDVIEQYMFIEPRASLKYELTELSSIKASYQKTTQGIHLMSNTAAATPIDIWTPSTNNIKPQVADQYAVGYFRNFTAQKLETSVEVYYKTLQNQIDYIDNSNVFFNELFEADLLFGDGRAYGAEFYVKRNGDKFNGWASYTLARTEKQIEGLNDGEWFPNRYDKLHNLSLVGSYEISKRWSASANFVFASGTPATFPTNRLEVQGWVIQHNAEGKRSNYRIPSYNRLDLSFTLQGKKNEGRKWKGEWVFSVYNLYGRKNPFSLYFQANAETPAVTEAIRLAIVGAPIPAVTYNFEF